jgi:CRP/FNR family transcriptional regulator, polysaccharide utilization system transcription regulator
MKQQDITVPLCGKCALESGSLFRHLTPEETEMLNYDKDFRQYKRGEVLYQEGSRISGFYCITSGIIKVFKTGLTERSRS